GAALVNGVIDDQQHPWFKAHIIFIDEDGALFELMPMLLKHDIGNRLHQGMPWMEETRHRRAHAIGETHILFLKADALVTREHRSSAMSISPGNPSIVLTNGAWHVGDLVTPSFTW